MSSIDQMVVSAMGPTSSIAWQGGKIYWGEVVVGRYDFKGTITMNWQSFPIELYCNSLESFEKFVLNAVIKALEKSGTNIGVLDMNQFFDLLSLTLKEVRAIETKGSRYKMARGHYRVSFTLDGQLIPLEIIRRSSGIFTLSHDDHLFEIKNIENLFDAIAKITKTLTIPIEKFLPFGD